MITRLKLGTLGTLCALGSYWTFGISADDIGLFSPMLGMLGFLFGWAAMAVADE